MTEPEHIGAGDEGAPARVPDMPAPPYRPHPLECCNRGCCPCIMDYYYDALDRWRDKVVALGGDPEALLAQIPPQV